MTFVYLWLIGMVMMGLYLGVIVTLSGGWSETAARLNMLGGTDLTSNNIQWMVVLCTALWPIYLVILGGMKYYAKRKSL